MIFKHPILIGKPCEIDEVFESDMNDLCSYAQECSLNLFVNSSLRNTIVVPGAIVTPAKQSNHLAGCAIDANIVTSTGKWYNNLSMFDADKIDRNVSDFLKLVRKHPRLRWGGNFGERDMVHYDNGLNINNIALYNELVNKHKINQ